jgi:hypothetical protein
MKLFNKKVWKLLLSLAMIGLIISACNSGVPPLNVSGIYPQNGQANINAESINIIIQFTNQVPPSTVTVQNIFLFALVNNIKTNVTINSISPITNDNTTYQLVVNTPLTANACYYLTFIGQNIIDVNGNSLIPYNATINFSTAPDFNC